MIHTPGWIIADYVCSSMSIVGGCLMLLSYAIFPELRTNFGRISMWFGICGIGAAIYPVMGGSTEGTFKCYAQSMIGSYFVLASMFASTILVHSIYRLFYPQSADSGRTSNVSGMQLSVSPALVAYTWGLPLVMAAIPLTTDSYGNDDGDIHCWVKTEQGRGRSNVGSFMSFATFYVPVWLCIIYNLALCVFIANKAISMKGDSDASRVIAATANKCKWYPIIAVSCWSLRTVTRVGAIFGYSPRIISSLGIAISYLHGFFDFLAYCYASRVLSVWKQYFLSLRKPVSSLESSLIKSSSAGAYTINSGTLSSRSHEMASSFWTATDSELTGDGDDGYAMNAMYTESVDSTAPSLGNFPSRIRKSTIS